MPQNLEKLFEVRAELSTLEDSTLIELARTSEGGQLAKDDSEWGQENLTRNYYFKDTGHLFLPTMHWNSIFHMSSHDQLFYCLGWNQQTGRPLRCETGLLRYFDPTKLVTVDKDNDPEYQEWAKEFNAKHKAAIDEIMRKFNGANAAFVNLDLRTEPELQEEK